MWAKFFGALKLLFNLIEELESLREEQKSLEARFEALREQQTKSAQTMRDIMHDLIRLRDHDQHEREKMLLQLENELLKFERRLPPRDGQ